MRVQMVGSESERATVKATDPVGAVNEVLHSRRRKSFPRLLELHVIAEEEGIASFEQALRG